VIRFRRKVYEKLLESLQGDIQEIEGTIKNIDYEAKIDTTQDIKKYLAENKLKKIQMGDMLAYFTPSVELASAIITNGSMYLIGEVLRHSYRDGGGISGIDYSKNYMKNFSRKYGLYNEDWVEFSVPTPYDYNVHDSSDRWVYKYDDKLCMSGFGILDLKTQTLTKPNISIDPYGTDILCGFEDKLLYITRTKAYVYNIAKNTLVDAPKELASENYNYSNRLLFFNRKNRGVIYYQAGYFGIYKYDFLTNTVELVYKIESGLTQGSFQIIPSDDGNIIITTDYSEKSSVKKLSSPTTFSYNQKINLNAKFKCSFIGKDGAIYLLSIKGEFAKIYKFDINTMSIYEDKSMIVGAGVGILDWYDGSIFLEKNIGKQRMILELPID